MNRRLMADLNRREPCCYLYECLVFPVVILVDMERCLLCNTLIHSARDFQSSLPPTTELPAASSDGVLSVAYPDLHVRRTLDQYFYTGIEDTRARDADQVIYRVQDRRVQSERWMQSARGAYEEPKIIVVDQLWLWILNKGLAINQADITVTDTGIHTECIISSFPGGQARGHYNSQDRGDLLGNIIESALISPSNTVYDQAARVTNCCLDSFNYERGSRAIETSRIVDLYDEALQLLVSQSK